MAKAPGFYFYPNDWKNDLEEHPLEIQGAWIVILCKLSWEETRGEATKSLDEWARILRENRKKTEKILKYLSKKFIADIHVLDNQNITIISRRMKRDSEISQKRREVGKMGGNPALKKPDENLDNQIPNQKCPPSFTIPITNTKDKKKKAQDAFVIPEWIDQKTWDDFIEVRKKLRKTPTDRAKKLIIEKLEKIKKEHGHEPNKVLEQSIENSYQSVFPLRELGNDRRGNIKTGTGQAYAKTGMDRERGHDDGHWVPKEYNGDDPVKPVDPETVKSFIADFEKKFGADTS